MKILVPYLHLLLSAALLASGIFWNMGIEIPLAVFLVVWCGGLVAMRQVWPSLPEDGPDERGFYPLVLQLVFIPSFYHIFYLLGIITMVIAGAAFIAFPPMKRRKKRSKEPEVS